MIVFSLATIYMDPDRQEKPDPILEIQPGSDQLIVKYDCVQFSHDLHGVHGRQLDRPTNCEYPGTQVKHAVCSKSFVHIFT